MGFVRTMLYEAFFWDPKSSRIPFDDFCDHPEFGKLLSGWGRRGDGVVIVEDNGVPLGAAWYRLWTKENHSYGFVDEQTPELGIAVRTDQRSKGIGRTLLRALLQLAKEDGFRALSLSVSPLNFARFLYEGEGFHKVGESGTSWTMLLRW